MKAKNRGTAISQNAKNRGIVAAKLSNIGPVVGTMLNKQLRTGKTTFLSESEAKQNCSRITRLTRPILPAEKINGLLFNIFVSKKLQTYPTFDKNRLIKHQCDCDESIIEQITVLIRNEIRITRVYNNWSTFITTGQLL